MLALNEKSAKELNGIRTACKYLFSSDHASDNEFLETLNINRVEEAFVNKTKENNPYVLANEPTKNRRNRCGRWSPKTGQCVKL